MNALITRWHIVNPRGLIASLVRRYSEVFVYLKSKKNEPKVEIILNLLHRRCCQKGLIALTPSELSPACFKFGREAGDGTSKRSPGAKPPPSRAKGQTDAEKVTRFFTMSS